jgi:hypothetical protein
MKELKDNIEGLNNKIFQLADLLHLDSKKRQKMIIFGITIKELQLLTSRLSICKRK